MSVHVRLLLDHALKEIEWRAPDYLARFPLLFTIPDPYYQRHVSNYPTTDESPSSFSVRFDQGLEYIKSSGARIEKQCSSGDPVAGMLSETIADAAGFETLEASGRWTVSEFRARLAQSYQEGNTEGGKRYFIRQRGEMPLLLIPALGIPLRVWSRLLLDDAHDFRIIVVETRSFDLFLGGMREKSSIKDDCSDITSVISNERLTGINVLAWCNGAKIALELVAEAGAAIRSIAFVSPSFSGPRDTSSDQSKYEFGLRQILAAINRKPELASLIARGFEQLTQPVDWDGLREQIERRAQALFNLPARDHAAALKCPFSEIDSLRKYAERGRDDYEYPTERRMVDVGVPCLLITGNSDQVVNSCVVAEVMRRYCRFVTHATMRGAGHYTFDLQYPYFRSILTEFFETMMPRPRVRVEIEELNSITSTE
jgi:pimeloyl-ACP methyl ester carboxylesterase